MCVVVCVYMCVYKCNYSIKCDSGETVLLNYCIYFMQLKHVYSYTTKYYNYYYIPVILIITINKSHIYCDLKTFLFRLTDYFFILGVAVYSDIYAVFTKEENMLGFKCSEDNWQSGLVEVDMFLQS